MLNGGIVENYLEEVYMEQKLEFFDDEEPIEIETVDNKWCKILSIDEDSLGNIVRILPNEILKDISKKIIFTKNDHLYVVIKLLDTCKQNPQFVDSLSPDKMNTIYRILEEKFHKQKFIIKLKKISIDWMCTLFISKNLEALLIDPGVKSTNQFSELFFYSVQLCVEHIKKVRKKALVVTMLETILSGAFTALTFSYDKNNDLQQAEIYARKHLALLDGIKRVCPQDIDMRYLSCKLRLANIYLKLGHLWLALNFIYEAHSLITRHYYRGFDSFLMNFMELSRKIAGILYQKESYFIALQVCKTTSMVLDSSILKSATLKSSPQIQKDKKFIELTFNAAKDKYLEKSFKELSTSAACEELLSKDIRYDFKEDSLTIFPKKASHIRQLGSTLHSLGLNVTRTGESLCIIDLENDTPTLLIRACKISLFNIQQEEQREQANFQARQQAAEQVILFSHTTSSQTSPEGHNSAPFFVEEKKPEKIPYTTACNEPIAEIKDAQKPEEFLPAKIARLKQIPTVINWPQSGLTYQSNKNGMVKKLAGKHLPDNVWFGYLLKGVLSNKDRNVFADLLEGGRVDHWHIRNITKELRCMRMLNYTKPYKFKIAPKKNDKRLLGWITEEIDGHFLVCFGLLINHKLMEQYLKNGHLPDPEKIESRIGKFGI